MLRIMNTSSCGSFCHLFDLLDRWCDVRALTPTPDARGHLKYAMKSLVNWNKILKRDDISLSKMKKERNKNVWHAAEMCVNKLAWKSLTPNRLRSDFFPYLLFELFVFVTDFEFRTHQLRQQPEASTTISSDQGRSKTNIEHFYRNLSLI